jgi:tetratricopeptide (TPR) repeat protein
MKTALLFLSVFLSVSLFGQSAEDYRQKGKELAEEEKYSEALINYLISKKMNPYNWELYSDIGYMHYNNKNYSDAIEAYESGKKLASTQDRFYYFLGKCYLAIGKNHNAILNFSTWMDLNTDNEDNFIGYSKYTGMTVLKDRGLAYLYSGNKKLACEDWYYAKRLKFASVDKYIEQHCE